MAYKASVGRLRVGCFMFSCQILCTDTPKTVVKKYPLWKALFSNYKACGKGRMSYSGITKTRRSESSLSMCTYCFVCITKTLMHLSDQMTLCLFSALFKYGTSSKLPVGVVRPHGVPFSVSSICWRWQLHPHEPQDFQLPQYKLQSWVCLVTQPSNVPTWRNCTASSSPTPQASLTERWEEFQVRVWKKERKKKLI